MKKFESKRFDRHDPDHKKDLEEAMEYYNKMIEDKHPYICLVFSNNWASEGYWVENSKPKYLSGYIIMEHDVSIIRDKKIDKII